MPPKKFGGGFRAPFCDPTEGIHTQNFVWWLIFMRGGPPRKKTSWVDMIDGSFFTLAGPLQQRTLLAAARACVQSLSFACVIFKWTIHVETQRRSWRFLQSWVWRPASTLWPVILTPFTSSRASTSPLLRFQPIIQTRCGSRLCCQYAKRFLLQSMSCVQFSYNASCPLRSFHCNNKDSWT